MKPMKTAKITISSYSEHEFYFDVYSEEEMDCLYRLSRFTTALNKACDDARCEGESFPVIGVSLSVEE